MQRASWKASAGSVFGYCAGTFTKQLSKELIWNFGLCSSMMGIMWWHGWIIFDFEEMQRDLTYVAGLAKETAMSSRVKHLLLYMSPLLAGFSGAFYYGFKYGA